MSIFRSCAQCCGSAPEEEIRLVHINDRHKNAHYGNNRIRNTKYTIWNFLIKNLVEQFSRFMNVYFLLIACLQLDRLLTPVDPVTTWVPLALIFGLSAAKEAIDDYWRYKADKQANERLYWVLRDQTRHRLQSQDIMVGDIIYLEDNDEAPCDMVILKTSDETGTCYVQTANLDGETDLKLRQALPETQSLSEKAISKLQGTIECAPPNGDFYKMDGRLYLSVKQKRSVIKSVTPTAQNPLFEYISISINNTILQATQLRNTGWLFGVAVYTGNQTKVEQNKSNPPIKWTKVDRFVNKLTIAIFLLQLCLIVGLSVAGNLWAREVAPQHWYLQAPTMWSTSMWFIIPIRFTLLLSLMIPISFKVSMDITKYFCAFFINWDLQIFDEQRNIAAEARNTAINENLGQVHYIFCDKTGTLTENVMRFSKCSIGSTTYGHDLQTSNALQDPRLREQVKAGNAEVVEFFRALALCNTVIPTYPKSEWEVVYRTSSPDEEAMVKAAAELNVKLLKRQLRDIELSVNDQTENYRLLHSLEFTPERKRMSVIVQPKDPAARYPADFVAQSKKSSPFARLYIKGADDKIIPLFQHIEDSTLASEKVSQFAKLGLRTMVIAFRDVSETEYKKWKSLLEDAITAIDKREEKLAEVYDLIEKQLNFLGVTAIEDKLQDNVKETLSLLQDAGIQIWVLTGDKMETAIQVAIQTGLLHEGNSNEYCVIEGSDWYQVNASFEKASNFVMAAQIERQMKIIVIDGKTLSLVLQHFAEKFVDLVLKAKAVLCSRVTPSQKAAIVKLIKKTTKKVTLAVGDGGNDVSMIQEAHIGVGIQGKEGLQAVRAADYSISRFCFLARLLLVHGRYSYRRICFVTLYCFQKSLFLAFIQIFFAFYSAFSGSSIFNTIALTTYSVVFTGLPILFYVLDKDVHEKNLLLLPRLYRETQASTFLNASVFSQWLVRALFQAAIVFFSAKVIFGDILDLSSFSMVCYTACIIIQTLTIVIESYYLTWLNHLVIWGTLAAYFGIIAFLSYIVQDEFHSVMFVLFEDITFWLALAIITAGAMLPIVVIKSYVFNYRPQHFQEVQKLQRVPESPYYIGRYISILLAVV